MNKPTDNNKYVMDTFESVCGPLRELALFSGAGGGILGGKLLGWETVCAVEIERYPQCVLAPIGLKSSATAANQKQP